MNKNERGLLSGLFILGLITRIPFLVSMQSHPDSSSFTLALSNYSFQQETPAPPGYPIYFAIAKIINFIIYDPYMALLVVSVIFSGVGTVLFYLAGKSFLNKTIGIIASLLFLSAPSIYFFGVTVYPYIVVAVMTLVLAWSVYRVYVLRQPNGFLLGLVYAICLGIRPQELLTTLPLFLLGFFSLPKKEKIKSFYIFIPSMLLWILPLLIITGGIFNYLKESSNAASQALPLPNLFLFVTNRFKLISGAYLTFGIGNIILIYFLLVNSFKYLNKNIISSNKTKIIIFYSFWIIPSLLFNLFIRTEHAGYQMGYLTGFLYILSFATYYIFKSERNRVLIVALVTISNLLIFFYDRDPGYLKTYRQSSLHHSDLIRNDYAIFEKTNYIKNNFDPKQTFIIVGPVFWKQAMFHLPEYQIYAIDAIFTDIKEVKYTRRDSINWRYKEYFSYDFSIKIDYPINNVILFDDESDTWVKDNYSIKQFKGITKLIIINVKKGDLLTYDLGKVGVINGK